MIMSVQLEVEIEPGGEKKTEEIPVLDLGPYVAGEKGAAERLAVELRYAQENIGFHSGSVRIVSFIGVSVLPGEIELT